MYSTPQVYLKPFRNQFLTWENKVNVNRLFLKKLIDELFALYLLLLKGLFALFPGDRTRTVQQLFKGGADINMTNGRGNTAIYESTSRYHTFSCWALLDCGVVVNTKENIRKFTDTVIGMKLHEKIDLKDTIRLMLEAGALMETEWLITLAGSYIVHHCLSLNRMFKHVTIPRTLQSCCHLVIRKHIKKPISEHLCELPLPQKVQDEIALINYVNFRPNSWRWGGDSDYWKRCY